MLDFYEGNKLFGRDIRGISANMSYVEVMSKYSLYWVDFDLRRQEHVGGHFRLRRGDRADFYGRDEK